jgi:hypothetical protein
MLRFLYLWLVRLHPRRFQKRFGDEMLSIFDEAQGRVGAAKLLGDGAVSLVRQWTLRPEFSEEPLAAGAHRVHEGAPTFCIVDDSLPCRRALINGTALSLVVFSVICFAMIYDQNHVVLKPFFSVPFDFSASSLPEGKPIQPSVIARRQFEGQSVPQLVPEHKSPRIQPAALPKVPANPPTAPTLARERTATGVKSAHTKQESRERQLIVSPPSPSRHGPTPSAGTWIRVEIPRRVLRSYAGTYVADAQHGLKLSVSFESDELRFEIPGEESRALLPVSETQFLVRDASGRWVEFSKNQDGTVQLDFYENDRHITARRSPSGSLKN